MKIKAGDTAPNPTFDLNVSTVGASAVVFRAMKLNGTFFQAGNAVMDDAANGIGHYVWTSSPTEGAYRCEVAVTYASGQIQRFPQRGYLEVVVGKAVPTS